MTKQMILTILIISIAFGTETKFQVRIIQLRLSAYSTLVLADCPTASARRPSGVDRFLEIPPALHFTGLISGHIPGGQKENDKIQQRCHHRNHHGPGPVAQICDDIINNHGSVQNSHPFDFQWENKPEQHFHIRICGSKSQQY